MIQALNQNIQSPGRKTGSKIAISRLAGDRFGKRSGWQAGRGQEGRRGRRQAIKHAIEGAEKVIYRSSSLVGVLGRSAKLSK